MNQYLIKVNLTKGKSSKETIKKSFAKKWIGGNGFGANWLLKYNKPKIDPFSPENALIFATGPLTGTAIPTSGKCGVFSKSPLTSAFGESYSGAHFGNEMRYSGLMGIIVTGKSRKPVYLWIDDGDVEIKNAMDIWGTDTFKAEKQIKRETHRHAAVAVIGQGGENLVRFACIQSEYGRNFGRTGIGAVMGSKNLKAIAVKGSQDVRASNFEKIRDFVKNWNSKIRGTPSFKLDTAYGTGEFIKWVSNERGVLPTRNFESGVFEKVDGLDPYKWSPKHALKNKACSACDKPCGRLFKSKGVLVEGPEYETLYSLGSACGISDVKIVAKAHRLCDEYGLDAISTGVIVGWAMDCFENGIITNKDVGIDLKFGNGRTLLNLIPDIAKKRGFGKILAEGSRRAAKKIGRGSERLTMEVKGLELPAYDVRGIKGLGLGFAVSPRGACHLRSCFYAVDLTGRFDPLNIKNVDRFSVKGKAKQLAMMEDLMAIYDSLILCKFSRTLFSLKDITNLLTWVTGMKYEKSDILKIGSEIMKKEREFNRREGFTEKDDHLPKKIKTPIPRGKSKGSSISKTELELMKKEYYEMRRD